MGYCNLYNSGAQYYIFLCMAKEKVRAGGSACDSEGTLLGMVRGSEDGVGVGGWYMQGLMAGDTGSESGPGCSGPHTGRSQVQGYQQPPYALPSPDHTVLFGLDPPISAEGGPHSCTGLSNSQGPCGCCIHQDLADAGSDVVWALCFL